MAALKDDAIAQIDRALALYQQLRGKSQYDDISDLEAKDQDRVRTAMSATLTRLAPPRSVYLRTVGGFPNRIAGSLEALRADYEDGYLASYDGLVRSDVFGDFLEMAEHLLNEGYKDPAAVVVGSVLESHLRALSVAKGIAVKSGEKYVKADRLNSELSKYGKYNKLDQKNVTAWLDLRNKAAHGHYSEYTEEQVKNQLAGVREFMARVP